MALSAEQERAVEAISLAFHSVLHWLKAMCHIHVEAPMVTNWFPYFLPTSSFFGTKRPVQKCSRGIPTYDQIPIGIRQGFPEWGLIVRI